jgi:hypothetical protein
MKTKSAATDLLAGTALAVVMQNDQRLMEKAIADLIAQRMATFAVIDKKTEIPADLARAHEYGSVVNVTISEHLGRERKDEPRSGPRRASSRRLAPARADSEPVTDGEVRLWRDGRNACPDGQCMARPTTLASPGHSRDCVARKYYLVPPHSCRDP